MFIFGTVDVDNAAVWVRMTNQTMHGPTGAIPEVFPGMLPPDMLFAELMASFGETFWRNLLEILIVMLNCAYTLKISQISHNMKFRPLINAVLFIFVQLFSFLHWKSQQAANMFPFLKSFPDNFMWFPRTWLKARVATNTSSTEDTNKESNGLKVGRSESGTSVGTFGVLQFWRENQGCN